jgi:hypothetical protein
MPLTTLSVAALFSFQADHSGSHELALNSLSPSGQLWKGRTPFAVEANRTANLILNLSISTEEEGLYWFDVLVDGEMVTKMPLNVVFETQPNDVGSGSRES